MAAVLAVVAVVAEAVVVVADKLVPAAQQRSVCWSENEKDLREEEKRICSRDGMGAAFFSCFCCSCSCCSKSSSCRKSCLLSC